MVDLSVFNRFIVYLLPIWAEEPVVKVNCGLAYEIVSKQVVIVVSLNNNWGCPWEFSIELVHFIEFGVWLVQLVVVPLVVLLLTAFDLQVRV